MLVFVDFAITFKGETGLMGGSDIAYLAMFEKSL